jgi:hypothetical protein
MSIRLVARWVTGATVALSLVVALGSPALGLIDPLAHGRFLPGTMRPLGDRDVVSLKGVSDWGLAEPGALALSIDDLEAGDSASVPSSDSLAALSDPIPLDAAAPYVAGVTWDADVQLRADARYFRAGEWGGWQELGDDGLTGDRPGSEDRRGTEPFIVTGVDAIQVRVYDATGIPTGLTVRLYSSAATASDATASDTQSSNAESSNTEVTTPALGSGGYSRALASTSAVAAATTPPSSGSTGSDRLVDIPQPAIHTRAEWGARIPTEWFESVTVQGAAVHNSAGTNDYLPADVPAILRSIQDLHVQGREFWDIAYNFLIDRYGEIWEGRAGGIDQAARGAHSHTFNPIVTGVCIMGNFQEGRVPTVAIDSLVALLAWKLTLHGAAADGILLHEGVWPAIIGHKDIPESSTACPGKYLYALLPEIRARVLAAQHLPAAPFTTDVTGDGTADIASILGDEVVIHSSGYTTAPAAPFQGVDAVADLAVSYDLITAGPSLTGAVGADVLARQTATGFLMRMSDDGTGTLGTPVTVAYEVSPSFILSPGDVTGDGIPDLVVGDESRGIIAVQAGDGTGHMGKPALAAPVVGALAAISPAGDVNGDGAPDLALILADSGVLAISFGDGAGGFGPPATLASGWGAFDEIAQAGDVSGDGIPDLLVRDSNSGRTRTLLGAAGGPTGAFIEWRAVATEWTSPMGAIGWGRRDGATLLALDASTGALVRPTPTSSASLAAPSTLTLSAPGVRSAAVVGDVDHNGFADVITWDDGGRLLLHPSTGTGFLTPIVFTDPADDTALEYVPYLSLDVPADLPIPRPYWAPFAPPAAEALPTVAPFWSEYTSIAPAGDIDFDGTPDLVAVTKTGDVVVYTLDAGHLSHPNRGLKIAEGLVGFRVSGVGPWRQGSISDLVAISPSGVISIVTGKGMTGAIVGGVVASGLGPDAVFQGLGQVEPDGGGAVSVYDPATGGVTTMARSGDNDWAPLGAPGP